MSKFLDFFKSKRKKNSAKEPVAKQASLPKTNCCGCNSANKPKYSSSNCHSSSRTEEVETKRPLTDDYDHVAPIFVATTLFDDGYSCDCPSSGYDSSDCGCGCD